MKSQGQKSLVAKEAAVPFSALQQCCLEDHSLLYWLFACIKAALSHRFLAP